MKICGYPIAADRFCFHIYMAKGDRDFEKIKKMRRSLDAHVKLHLLLPALMLGDGLFRTRSRFHRAGMAEWQADDGDHARCQNFFPRFDGFFERGTSGLGAPDSGGPELLKKSAMSFML
jgi:hypothetical protein